MLQAEPGSGDALGLARDIFAAAVAPRGLDGGNIFDRLMQGRSLAEALRLPTELVGHLYARAYGWLAVGRFDRAEPLFHGLCLLEARCADYWVGYAYCLMQRQDWDAARSALQTAADLRQDWELPRLRLCEVDLHRGDLPSAAAALGAFRTLKHAATPAALVAEADRFAAAIASR